MTVSACAISIDASAIRVKVWHWIPSYTFKKRYQTSNCSRTIFRWLICRSSVDLHTGGDGFIVRRKTHVKTPRRCCANLEESWCEWMFLQCAAFVNFLLRGKKKRHPTQSSLQPTPRLPIHVVWFTATSSPGICHRKSTRQNQFFVVLHISSGDDFKGMKTYECFCVTLFYISLTF